MSPIDSYLTTEELAKRWGVSEGTLANWRTWRKGGPAYEKKGWAVLYRLSVIERYEKHHTHGKKPKK